MVSVSSDSYYKGLAPGADAASNNWDHPAALDLELLAAHLNDLRAGRSIRVPEYSFVAHARMPEAAARFVSAADTDVVIVDGIFVLHDEGVRAACLSSGATRLKQRLGKVVSVTRTNSVTNQS